MKKRIVSLLLVIALFCSLLPSFSFEVKAAGTSITRLAGTGRCETAIEAAENLKKTLGKDKLNSVIIASGNDFADALAGSYLAAVKKIPILLYRNKSSINLNLEYLAANGCTNVYLLGGSVALPKELETALQQHGIATTRLAGNNRYATNLQILKEANVQAGQEILVATAYNFADSLSASATGKPILLVNSNSNKLTDGQIDFLRSLPGSKLTILGGENAVSQKLEKQLETYGEVKRLAGSNRYETSTLIAETYFTSPSNIVVAYGKNFPDGLSGGPVAFSQGAPLILTASGAEKTAAAYVEKNSVKNAYIMGGTAAISEKTVNRIFGQTTPTTPTVPDKPTDTPKSYTVTFKNYDGAVLKAETVESGKNATAPTVPAREGYTFSGWDKEFTNVTSDLTVTAQYQVTVLPEGTYRITYNMAGSDTYLQKQTITNSNPATYSEGQTITLKNISVPGYKFKGWYDSEGTNAEQIKKIENQTGDIELYAHWEKVTYSVMFESDLVPVEEDDYTVDKGLVLPTPKLDGYIFVGWSNDNGEVLKKIEPGTVGNQTYTANWLSERNQAWTKNKLDKPIIMEEDGQILFIYEIGEIRNVPLSVIHDFGKINQNGVTKTVTATYSETISEELMEAYTNTVAKATTETSGWTLSNGWSENTSINEEWAKEQGLSQEQIDSISNTQSEGRFITDSNGGVSSTVTHDETDTYNLTTATKNKTTYGSTTTEKRDLKTSEWNVNGKVTAGYENSTTIGANIGGNLGYEEDGASAGLNAGLSAENTSKWNIGAEIGGGYTSTNEKGTVATAKTGADEENGSNDQTGTVKHGGTTKTNESNWNHEEGYESSKSTTNNHSLSTAISEKISSTYGYGKSYIGSKEEGVEQGHSASESASDTYSSSVTWSATKEKSVTEEYTTENTMSGYHRWVMAGTAHVFAVVGYDIATSSYYVTNYSVMDDEQHAFEDYSYSYSSYDDNQTGVISFEVPTDVYDYVSKRICESEGLEVSKEGIITGYKYSGEDTCVMIPEYKVIQNADGTKTAIKITGISSNAFKGNTKIKSVILSDYITEIPANAFAGCTSLFNVSGSAVTKIGDGAFKGCTAMKQVLLGDNIVSMGKNVYDSLDALYIKVSNPDVAKAALVSGAKNVYLYLADNCKSFDNVALTVPDTVGEFHFHAYGKEFNNLIINSNATQATVITRATLRSTGKTPLDIASKEIVLQDVIVNSSGIALITSADSTALGLYGESKITSETANAMLTKNLTLKKFDAENSSYYSHLTVTGNLLVCGEVKGTEYLTVTGGITTPIDAAAFESYRKGVVVVNFNANGGTVNEASKTLYFGQAYGEMPVPTRKYYTFDGWYTAAEGGNNVTADSTISSAANQTLYAHWTRNTYKIIFNANNGTVSEGNRTVFCGDEVGALPVPARDYHNFLGWYTEANGGTQVTEKLMKESSGETTIYAHWELKPLSDWTLAANTPAGARVDETKWSYTETTNTESRETSLAGYTQTGSYWVQSETGSKNYATFPSGFDTSNSIYKSFSKSALSASETETTKREVSNKKAGYVYWHWMYNCDGAAAGNRRPYYKKGVNSENNYGYYTFDAWTSSKNYSSVEHSGQSGWKWYKVTDSHTSNKDSGGSYYWYRFEYYTSSYTDYYKMFQYQKVENKESTSEVTAGGSISNVQKWVRYREK